MDPGREALTRCALAAASAALLAGAPGCANLEAVRGFARASAASADAPQVIQDFAGAPVRLKRYEPPERAAELDALAARRRADGARLSAIQGVLVAYFTSLGDVAAGDLPNVSDPVDGFFARLEPLAGADDRTAGAASSIAKVLIRAGMDGWRRRKTAQLVREADPHVQAVIAALKDVVGHELDDSLDQEQRAVEKRFRAWEAAARGRDPDGAPPVARVLLEEHLEVVAQRRAAARAYAQALDTIGKGHASLARSAARLDRAELQKELRSAAGDLRTLYKAVRVLAN